MSCTYSLYEDNVNGDISERNYKQLSATYEREQAELENKINELNAQLIYPRCDRNYNSTRSLSLYPHHAKSDDTELLTLRSRSPRILPNR